MRYSTYECTNTVTQRLTHWGRVTHIRVSKLSIIGSDNGLSPGRRQAITWTNAGILLIQTLRTNFSEILREIYTFSFKKMHLKCRLEKCRPSCLGLNVLRFPLLFFINWQLNVCPKWLYICILHAKNFLTSVNMTFICTQTMPGIMPSFISKHLYIQHKM